MSAITQLEPKAAPRRRLGFTLAALLAVVGLAAAGLWGVTAVLDQIQRPEEFVRVDIPGEVSVSITSTGPHVVYYEGTEPEPTAEQIDVTGPDGADIPVRQYGPDLRYDVPGTYDARGEGGVTGAAVGVFTTKRTGTHTVGTDASADGALAVGDDLAPGAARAIVLPALLGVLAVLGSVVIAISTAARLPAGRS
jgi:hypothetical protein